MNCFVATDEDSVLQAWLQDPTSVIPFSRPLYSALREEANPSLPPPSQGEAQKLSSSLPL